MTLEELILQYKIKDYKFYKIQNKDGNEINTHFVFETHGDYLDKYLAFYKNLPNLTELIVHAPDGTFKITNNGIEYFIRHNHQEVFIDNLGHQRGIEYLISKKVRDNLLKRINKVLAATTFDKIIEIVTECRVKGFGELAIYDTSMRIASYLNIEPDKVYLHAGTRKGMEILEIKGYVGIGISKMKYVETEILPKELKVLKAAETEHFLCSMKENMQYLDNCPVKGYLSN